MKLEKVKKATTTTTLTDLNPKLTGWTYLVRKDMKILLQNVPTELHPYRVCPCDIKIPRYAKGFFQRSIDRSIMGLSWVFMVHYESLSRYIAKEETQ